MTIKGSRGQRLPSRALPAAALVGAMVVIGLLSGAAPATASADGPGGVLSLHLAGLPRGTKGLLRISGPPQSPSSTHRFHREVSLAALRRLHLRAGRYQVKVARVRVRRGQGGIKHGAVAFPVKRKLRVTIRAGHVSKVTVRYGTIINPGVRAVSGRIARVLGDPLNPSGVVLKPGVSVSRGAVLSAAPSSLLPRGLLAKVTSVTRSGREQTATLEPEDIYDVAPNMNLDVDLNRVGAAKLSSLPSCNAGELNPIAEVSDFHLTGGWTTTHVLFTDVKTGAHVELHYRLRAGVSAAARIGVKCSATLLEVGLQGMAGPIPVYGGFRPTASLELGAAASMQATGTVDVTTGLRVNAIPPSAAPILDFSSPRFQLTIHQFAGLKASLGLNAEIGIGVANAANIHASIDNDVDFTAAPGHCSWDLNLGSFSAGGQIGPFSISTPSTPPLYHRNLWHSACGRGAQPPPPPPPALPVTRATLDWDTDTDIDLYAWDEAGDEAYYGELLGIPGAELVHDVIPSEGEFEHEIEVFRETAEPGRRYTFGVCDYHGEGGDLTLTVTDPSGATRVFHTTLFEEGEGEILAISPDGGGYIPPPGWCRFAL